MRDILADLRFAVRGLARRPAFALSAVVTLALGIGLTATMFSVLNGVVLQPLPFPNAKRLITLCEQYPGSTPAWCSISPPNVQDVAARSRSIEALGIGRTWGYHLATPEGQKAVNAGIVTPGLFRALGVRPHAGRLFEDEDLIGDHSRVAVLSYEMWQTRYGGDQAVLGRSVTLDGVAVTVVGIAPPGLTMPRQGPVELWRTVHFKPDDEQTRGWPGFVAYGLLREGARLESARAEVNAIAAQIRPLHFPSAERWGISVQSVQDLVVGRVRPVMLLFLAAVVGVLLVACANVANLLLVRGNLRARELAVRAALGGGRARIARGLLMESLVLALAAATLGLLIAMGGLRAFKLLAPAGIPRVQDVTIDGTVLLFTLGLAMASALFFGVWPALRAVRPQPASALREGGRGSSHQGGLLGAALVVAELALAVTLVSGAGLLVRTFAAYSAWDPRFERQELVMFSLFAPETKYPGGEQIAALWDRVENELSALSGVKSVATASAGPLFGGDGQSAIELEGRAAPDGASAAWFDVSPSWFTTLGVPIVRGRNLSSADVREAPRVALVNETFAARFWSGESAVGKRFSMLERRLELTIVGVVADVPKLQPGDPTDPEVYWSNRQLPRPYTYVMVRSPLPLASLGPVITARLASIDPELEPGGMRPYAELVATELKRPRFTMLLLVSFSVVALVLASVGVYGLLAYIVSTRRREIGIRLALGAHRRQVVAGYVGWALRLTALGIAIGTTATFALGRVLESHVAGVSARDPATLGASAVVLVIVALAACVLPAYRASKVDPAGVLAAD